MNTTTENSALPDSNGISGQPFIPTYFLLADGDVIEPGDEIYDTFWHEWHPAESYVVFNKETHPPIRRPATFQIYFISKNKNKTPLQQMSIMSYAEAKSYIDRYNGTNKPFFSQFPRGTVTIECVQTRHVVYEKKIITNPT
jgi:hypothetical protein